jgi:hypothetical protein
MASQNLHTSRQRDPNKKAELYQVNADKWTQTPLGHHFISTMCHSNMFQPLNRHFQGTQLIQATMS